MTVLLEPSANISPFPWLTCWSPVRTCEVLGPFPYPLSRHRLAGWPARHPLPLNTLANAYGPFRGKKLFKCKITFLPQGNWVYPCSATTAKPGPPASSGAPPGRTLGCLETPERLQGLARGPRQPESPASPPLSGCFKTHASTTCVRSLQGALPQSPSSWGSTYRAGSAAGRVI